MKARRQQQNPLFYIDNIQTFRQVFLSSLSKLSDNSTHKTGLEEIRDLLVNHIQDNDRLLLVLNCLSEHNEHMKTSTKKETIKVLTLLSEIFEERIIDLIPRILTLVARHLKENDGQINTVVSEAMGSVVGYGLKNLSLEIASKHLNTILKFFYGLFNGANKFTQIGAAMCITKVIQSSPVECLYCMVDELTWKLIELLKLPNCKANLQLFESVLSLILAVEENLSKLREISLHLLPLVVENMAHADWNVRKISVEVVYTLSVLVPDILAPYKQSLLDVLNHCRFDKIKNVRDIAVSAINSIKELKEVHQKDEKFFKGVPSPNRDSGKPRLSNEHSNRWIDMQNRKDIENENDFKEDIQRNAILSPKTRMNREINPNFFRNASKNKGEIEIRVKTPPKNISTANPLQNINKYVGSTSNNIPGTTTSNGGFTKNDFDMLPVQYETNSRKKFEFEPQKDQTENQGIKSIAKPDNELMNKNQQQKIESAKAKKHSVEDPGQILENRYSAGGDKTPVTTIHLIENEQDLAGATFTESLVKLQNEKKNQNQAVDPSLIKDGKPQNQNNSPIIQQESTKDDLSNIFKQLLKIKKQQTKIVNTISTYQSITQNDIYALKSKVAYLENFVEKIYKMQTQTNPAFPMQSPNYYHYPSQVNLQQQFPQPLDNPQYNNYMNLSSPLEQNLFSEKRPFLNNANFSNIASKPNINNQNFYKQGVNTAIPQNLNNPINQLKSFPNPQLGQAVSPSIHGNPHISSNQGLVNDHINSGRDNSFPISQDKQSKWTTKPQTSKFQHPHQATASFSQVKPSYPLILPNTINENYENEMSPYHDQSMRYSHSDSNNNKDYKIQQNNNQYQMSIQTPDSNFKNDKLYHQSEESNDIKFKQNDPSVLINNNLEGNNNDIFEAVKAYLNAGMINEAIKMSLRDNDHSIFLRLINEHGLEKELQFLDDDTIDILNDHLVSLLSNEYSRSGTLQWIERICATGLNIDSKLINSMMQLLSQFSNEDIINNGDFNTMNEYNNDQQPIHGDQTMIINSSRENLGIQPPENHNLLNGTNIQQSPHYSQYSNVNGASNNLIMNRGIGHMNANLGHTNNNLRTGSSFNSNNGY